MVADRVINIKDGQLVSDDSPVVALGYGQELASQLAEITAEAGLITIEQVTQ